MIYTIGGIHTNGCMHMNDEYGPDGYSETNTWHIFGDPSLQIRTNTPEDMTVEHDDLIPNGADIFELEVLGVKNALCAISHEYKILGYTYTDETGHAIIHFEDPVEFPGEDLDLVITAYNKNPYFAKLHTPYVDLKIDTIKGGLFYIETTIKNIGELEANNITWEIFLEGGTIILGRNSTGIINSIPAEGEETVRSNLIFGFGQIRVKINVAGDECFAQCDRGGKVFLILILVNLGGG